MTHNVIVALIALGALVLGMALVAWRERKKGRVCYAVSTPGGVPLYFGKTRTTAWIHALGYVGRSGNPRPLEVAIERLKREGYRCARFRVTKIGDAE